MTTTCLIDKKCIPCQGGTPPIEVTEAQKLLGELPEWKINVAGHLHKEYKFKDFMEGLKFINQIAEIAEREGHHPDLTLSWGRCAVEIWTHKINGLTESDFILAAKIEGLTQPQV